MAEGGTPGKGSQLTDQPQHWQLRINRRLPRRATYWAPCFPSVWTAKSSRLNQTKVDCSSAALLFASQPRSSRRFAAGSGAMSINPGGDWRTLECALRNSLQLLRDKWAQRTRLWGNTDCAPGKQEEAKQLVGTDASPPSALETLPVRTRSSHLTSSNAAVSRYSGERMDKSTSFRDSLSIFHWPQRLGVDHYSANRTLAQSVGEASAV